MTQDQPVSLPDSLDELAAFESWYLREQPRLVTVLCAMLDGDRATAAELADETCARALERWDRVGRMASPGGWAYRVACNLARRRFRRGRRAVGSDSTASRTSRLQSGDGDSGGAATPDAQGAVETVLRLYGFD